MLFNLVGSGLRIKELNQFIMNYWNNHNSKYYRKWLRQLLNVSLIFEKAWLLFKRTDYQQQLLNICTYRYIFMKLLFVNFSDK